MNGYTTLQNQEYQHERAERQFKIAQLRLAGLSDQDRMAKILGVSQSTISRDMKDIDQQLQLVAYQDIAVAKGNEIERIERLIAAIWRNAISGDLPTIDRVLKLIERKAKMLGLDAPITIRNVEDEARRLTKEFGFDYEEVMKEANRIFAQNQKVASGFSGAYAGTLPESSE